MSRVPRVPCPKLALDFYPTAVQRYDALDNCQTQASAARGLRRVGINPEETIKDSRQSVGWNSGSGIGNIDANRSIFSIRAEPDRSTRWWVRQGI